MKLLKTIGAASAMALLFAAPATFAHDTDDDKGPKVEKSYDFQGFDKIEIEGVYDVHITVGDDFSIETSGKAKRMDKVEVSVRGDTLVLGTKRGSSWKGKNNGVRADVTLPLLIDISLSGVGSVEATGIDADDFEVALEGVGSVELSGTCGKLEASVEGIGSLDARELECARVDVDLEGMGSAEVFASESVDADIDGMGSIDIYGEPSGVEKSKSMMSSVTVH